MGELSRVGFGFGREIVGVSSIYSSDRRAKERPASINVQVLVQKRVGVG
jgi:hypothetical protein